MLVEGNKIGSPFGQEIILAPAIGLMDKGRFHGINIRKKCFQGNGVKKGLLATPEHLVKTERILGTKPRSFDSFVAETVKVWK